MKKIIAAIFLIVSGISLSAQDDYGYSLRAESVRGPILRILAKYGIK